MYCGWIFFWRKMNLTLQEVNALMASLQLMSIRDKNIQEDFLGVEYAKIYKKLENYRFNLTSF
jgi:hypothetical protein